MRNKIFIFIFFTFFVFFLMMLFAQSEGYYKNRNEKAKILTDKQIEKFEKDIASGKDVDIKKYVLYEDKDYSNKVSGGVYKASLKIEFIFDKTIKLIFNKMIDVTQ